MRGLDQERPRPLEESRDWPHWVPAALVRGGPRAWAGQGPGQAKTDPELLLPAAETSQRPSSLKNWLVGQGPRPGLRGSSGELLGLTARTPALSFIYLNSSWMLGTSSCNRKPLPHQFS